MPPRKKAAEPKEELLVVVPVDDMILQHLRKHCLERHRYTMRLITRGEHEADHRLHQEVLNHTHSNMIKEEAEDAEV